MKNPAPIDERATHCEACGWDAEAAQLRPASLPTPAALIAFMVWPRQLRGVAGHDFADRSWYCPACRRRVNLRRGIAFLLIVVVPIVLARLVLPWLIYFLLPARF